MRNCTKVFHTEYIKKVHNNPCENAGLNHKQKSDEKGCTQIKERTLEKENLEIAER